MTSQRARPVAWRWWGPVLVALVASWVGLRAAHAARAPRVAVAAQARPAAAKVGVAPTRRPWGVLQTRPIIIRPPLGHIDKLECSDEATLWTLPEYDQLRLQELIRLARPGPEVARALLASAHCTDLPLACELRPSPRTVLALSPSARAALYDALGEFPVNEPQNAPWRVRAVHAARWLRAPGLSPKTLQLLERLSYREGKLLLFADLPLVCALTPDRGERRRLMSTLLSTRALLVSLRVTPQDDIATLARYWGRSKREHAVGALLQSVAEGGPGGQVDIMHLLPLLARRRLNTFPVLSEPARDCFWTALNFPGEAEDDALIDSKRVRFEVDRRHQPVPADQALLGDVVLFRNRAGLNIHAAAYVADDIAFTKNGASHRRPWTLMRVSEISDLYGATSVVYLRRKAP